MSAKRSAGLLGELRRLADAHGRSYAALYKVASTTFHTSASFGESYRDLGVDHLQVVLSGQDARATISLIQQVAAHRES